VRALVLAFFVALAVAKPAFGQGIDPQVVASVTRSTVAVVCFSKTQPVFVEGSGFFVNSAGYFVTPKHIVADLVVYTQQHACDVSILVIESQEIGASVQVKVINVACRVSKDYDIAVCWPKKTNPFTDRDTRQVVRVGILDITPRLEGTDLAFTGFPMQQIVPITSVGIVAGYMYGPGQPLVVLIDKIAWGGDSGSPMYYSDGKIAGMITATGSNNLVGISTGIASSVIHEFLKQQHVPEGK
jgi:trypsin-like peptidase